MNVLPKQPPDWREICNARSSNSVPPENGPRLWRLMLATENRWALPRWTGSQRWGTNSEKWQRQLPTPGVVPPSKPSNCSASCATIDSTDPNSSKNCGPSLTNSSDLRTRRCRLLIEPSPTPTEPPLGRTSPTPRSQTPRSPTARLAQPRTRAAGDLQQALAQAKQAQSESLGSLESLVDSLSRWSDLQRFTREAAELEQLQRALAAQTQREAAQAAGRPSKPSQPASRAREVGSRASRVIASVWPFAAGASRRATPGPASDRRWQVASRGSAARRCVGRKPTASHRRQNERRRPAVGTQPTGASRRATASGSRRAATDAGHASQSSKQRPQATSRPVARCPAAT